MHHIMKCHEMPSCAWRWEFHVTSSVQKLLPFCQGSRREHSPHFMTISNYMFHITMALWLLCAGTSSIWRSGNTTYWGHTWTGCRLSWSLHSRYDALWSLHSRYDTLWSLHSRYDTLWSLHSRYNPSQFKVKFYVTFNMIY